VFELTRPDGRREVSGESRYPVSEGVIHLEPYQKIEISLPVTRWYSFTDTGPYLLTLQGATKVYDNTQQRVEFRVSLCSAVEVISACHKLLEAGPEGLEAIAGFEAPEAVPCLSEALDRKPAPTTALIHGLAKIGTTPAIEVLIQRFETGDAFDRLAVWEALRTVNPSGLGPPSS